MEYKDLLTLAKTTAKADRSASVAYSFGDEKFSYNDLNTALRTEINKLAGTNALYRRNKNTIFELIEQSIDDVLPVKVEEQYGMFAEIRTIGQGDKYYFTQKITEASKRRAKQFVTKVGLAGRYEVFRLDGRKFEVPTTAYGGAAQIGFEEFLDGRVQMSDVQDIITEGLDEVIYKEIQKGLLAAIDTLPAANVSTQTAFDEAEMDRLISIADSYGGKASIYCTYEFAATMVPADDWVSSDMKNEKWNNGYLANYKGHRVIVMRQSYEDETNTVKVMDPSYAYIMTGVDKPVKIVFEGQTQVKDADNEDWSREIQTYKKFGVAVMANNDLCIYRNTSLTK